MELSDWFKGFEKGISCLNEEQRASFFSECGKNCVKCGTLQIYQELYEKANGDLDTFFSEADKLPGVKSEIIEKGFQVTICESILRGSQHCKMQIETTDNGNT